MALVWADCMLRRAQIGGLKEDGVTRKFVIRPYTPCSPATAEGHFDLVVKVYENGKLSKHFGGLKAGDTVEFKGPMPKLAYTANMKKHIGMVAGGTGITPMLQVIEKSLNDPKDHTKISLIFANVTEDDIILRDQIDRYAKQNPKRFSVFYVLDNPPANWKGGEGYISKEMLSR